MVRSSESWNVERLTQEAGDGQGALSSLSVFLFLLKEGSRTTHGREQEVSRGINRRKSESGELVRKER